MNDDDVKVLKKGRFIELARRGKWEYVRRHGVSGVVGIVATTDLGELILIEQFRPPVDARVVELPAGLVGDEGAETPGKAAKRELLEETGYRARRVTKLSRGVVSPGLTDEAIDLVRAENVVKVAEGGGVAGEDVEVHLVPVAGVEAFLKRRRRSGRMVDWKVWAALWFCRDIAGGERGGGR